MWQVIDDTQFCMMTTDFFFEAVAYAHQNGWKVYSTERKVIVYDGIADEVYFEEVKR